MTYDSALFYTGDPVETPIGQIPFKTVGEYAQVLKHIGILQQVNKMTILTLLSKNNAADLLKIVRNYPFVDITIALNDTPIFTQWVESIKYFLNTNPLEPAKPLIYTDEELDEYLELIYHMNCVTFPDRLTGNPEIDRFINYRKKLRQVKGGTTIEAIMSSVAVFMGLSNEELKNLTIYQLYVNFYRINSFKSFDVTTMYRMMDGKVKLVEWSKHQEILDTLVHKEKKLGEVNKFGATLFNP